MGWVTPIVAVGQVEYRVAESAGCGMGAGHSHAGPGAEQGAGHDIGIEAGGADPMTPTADAQVDYRLRALPMYWIGDGLTEVGMTPGASFAGEADRQRARALMEGTDPRTGEILVKPKMAIDPRGKIAAAPLVSALTALAEQEGAGTAAGLFADKWHRDRVGRAERGVAREGQAAHKIGFRDAEKLAGAAGVDLSALYDAKTLAGAEKYADAHIRVGVRGFDVVADLPKSASALWALAGEPLAARLEQLHRTAIEEGFTGLQRWTSYTMSGHHGDGQSAEAVESSGFLGWVMPHQVARPVPDATPDPHLHAHVVIANMAKGEDGKWRTVAAGGRDLHRHAVAFDNIVKARFRALTHEQLGVTWEQDPNTGAWEITGIPPELRAQLSKRAQQVTEELADLGLGENATRGQAKTVSAQTREASAGPVDADLRASWLTQAAAVGVDVDALLAQVAPGPAAGPTVTPTVDMDALAETVFDADRGVTAHRKAFRRTDLLAAVAAALPGVQSVEQVEELTDNLLSGGITEQLPTNGPDHLANSDRHTTRDILRAEKTIVGSVRRRVAEQAAVIPTAAAEAAIEVVELSKGYALSEEQREASLRLMTRGYGIDQVSGAAGTGKTTMLSAVRSGWEAAGLVVAGASTAAVAAQKLQAESGIRSATVASWVWRVENGRGLRGVDVLVIDEAAMCDDRQVARLVAAAEDTGTKVVLLGDEAQLRSPGAGGSFSAVDELIEAARLIENRRQQDPADVAALNQLRDGAYAPALRSWAERDHVHAVDDPATAVSEILTTWDQARAAYTDPHAQIEGLLVLAGTNKDVDALNAGARALRESAGELGETRTYLTSGGRSLDVSVGDIIITRVTERRGDEPDLLNGWRGVVTNVDADGIDVQISPGADPVRFDTEYMAAGGIRHGYAMTIHLSQGQTADRALILGTGLDAHALYPALSRARDVSDLWLVLSALENVTDQLARGPAGSDAERLDRAIAGYVAQLEATVDDIMVSPELDEHFLDPIEFPEPDPADASAGPEPAASLPLPEFPAPWNRRHGMRTDEQLANAHDRLTAEIETLTGAAETARAAADAAESGAGPAITALTEHRARTQDQATAISQAQDARDAHQDARDALADLIEQQRDAERDAAEASRRRDRQAAGDRAEALADPIAQARQSQIAAAVAADAAQTSAENIAGPRDGWPDIIAEHRRLAGNWSAEADRAAQADRAHAAAMREAVETATAAADKAREQLAPVDAERAVRDRMSSGYRAIEDNMRGLPGVDRATADTLRAALFEADRLPQGYTPWHLRPAGHLPDEALPARQDALRTEAETQEEAAKTRAERAAAIRTAAAGGDGRHARQLRQEGRRLRDGIRLERESEPWRDDMEDALKRAADAREELAEVRALQARGRTGAWRAGTTPGTLNDRADQLRHEIRTSDEAAAVSAEALRTLYGGEFGERGSALAAWEQYDAAYPRRRDAAIERDKTEAEPHAVRHGLRATRHHRAAVAAREALDQVAAERTLREYLPVGVAALEDVTRDQAAQQRRAAEQATASPEAARRAAGRNVEQAHIYDRPPGHTPYRGPDRGGPGLGR